MKRHFELDFIRVLAFFMIFWFHFQVSLINAGATTTLPIILSTNCESFGFLGVGLFLILSGYVLGASYERSSSLTNFYLKRILAILPVFYVGYFLAYWHELVPHGVFFDKKMIFTLLGVDGYLAIGGSQTTYLIGEWYLGVILVYYLLFPLLYTGIKRKPLISGILVLGVYLFCSFIYFPEKNRDASIVLRLPEFCFGIYYSLYGTKLPKITAGITGIIFLGLSIFSPIRDYNPIELIADAMLFVTLCYIGRGLELFCTKNKIGSKFIKVITSFSKYTYAMFLMHHITQLNVFSSYNGREISAIKTLLLFVICFVITFFLACIIEEATLSLLKKCRKKRTMND